MRGGLFISCLQTIRVMLQAVFDGKNLTRDFDTLMMQVTPSLKQLNLFRRKLSQLSTDQSFDRGVPLLHRFRQTITVPNYANLGKTAAKSIYRFHKTIEGRTGFIQLALQSFKFDIFQSSAW